MHRLTDVQDGGHGANSRRKVLPSDERTRSICLAHIQQRPPVRDP